MRKPLFIAIGLACLLAAPAWGGLATFEGLNPGSVGNEVWVDAGTDVQFDITVSVEVMAGFNVVDMTIGSDEVPDLSFDWSAELIAAASSTYGPAYDNGIYAQDVYVGAQSPSSMGTSLLLGTLTVKTDGLPNGDYVIRVYDEYFPVEESYGSILGLDLEEEVLSGVGIIHIPEPSCLGLLLVAGFVACLRRR